MTSPEPLIGATAGNYRIEELLGAGAMGQVFLGVHPQIGRKVAVKVLNAHILANADAASRFLEEARAVNCIDHPGVVQVFDFGQLPDGRLYLVMEYLSGRTLSDFMRERTRLSLRETLDLLAPIAAALDAAHAAGVVHRDLKPDNIFLAEGKDGVHVKIVDFGIAKVLEPAQRAGERTATGIIMGTPAYMSPEQAAGNVHDIGPASDIYSLAIIVYRMLSGRLPFEADFIPQLLVKHVDEPPTPISRYLSGFPEEIWRVLEKALAKSPQERFSTAGDFVRALNAAAQNLEMHRTLAPFETRDAISFHVLRPPAETRSPVPKRPRKLWLALAFGLVLLTGMAVSLYFLPSPSTKPLALFSTPPQAAPMAIPDATAGAAMAPDVLPPPGGSFGNAAEKTHRLRVETEPPGLPVVVQVDNRRMDGVSPFELPVRQGAAVRIASSDSRHAGMVRELVVTADVVVFLAATAPVETSAMGPRLGPPKGMTAPALDNDMAVRPPGEDDTVRPMF